MLHNTSSVRGFIGRIRIGADDPRASVDDANITGVSQQNRELMEADIAMADRAVYA